MSRLQHVQVERERFRRVEDDNRILDRKKNKFNVNSREGFKQDADRLPNDTNMRL